MGLNRSNSPQTRNISFFSEIFLDTKILELETA